MALPSSLTSRARQSALKRHLLFLALMVLACACVIVGLAFGVRQSFGLFMRPMTLDLGWGRETLSLVFANTLETGLGRRSLVPRALSHTWVNDIS